MLKKMVFKEDFGTIGRLAGHLLVYCMVFAVYVCAWYRIKSIITIYNEGEGLQVVIDLFDYKTVSNKMVVWVTDHVSTFAKEAADQAARECFQQSDNLFLRAMETSVLYQPIGSCILRNTQYIFTRNMAYLDNRIANDMDQIYRLFFLVKWGLYIGYANTAALVYTIRTRNTKIVSTFYGRRSKA
jgi:hypothetical protein